MTPKFNRICQHFMALCGDPITENAGIIQAGRQITSVAEIENYVNRGMNKLFNDAWVEAHKDASLTTMEKRSLFLSIFPELAELKTFAIYNDPAKMNMPGNFAGIISAVLIKFGTQNVKRPFSILPISEYHNLLAGNGFSIYTKEEPALVEIGKTLFVFPEDLPGELVEDDLAKVLYIKNPCKEDGSLITSGGDVDSPFNDTWSSKIAEISYRLYALENKPFGGPEE